MFPSTSIIYVTAMSYAHVLQWRACPFIEVIQTAFESACAVLYSIGLVLICALSSTNNNDQGEPVQQAS